MKKNVAIFIDTETNSGGAYEESLYLIKNIERLNKGKINLIIISTSKTLIKNFQQSEFKSKYFSMNAFERYICFLRNYGSLVRRIKKYLFFKNKFETFLYKNNIDLVYFTNPSAYSLYLEDTDFILTVPDVSHREEIEFPDWTKSQLGDFQRREEVLSKSTIRAIAVITNAEIIKNRISFFYSILKERIYVISQRPSLSISKFEKINEVTSQEFKKKIYSS